MLNSDYFYVIDKEKVVVGFYDKVEIKEFLKVVLFLSRVSYVWF